MNFAYFSRRKFFSDLYPKNNFPWKILGVTWFKKTNVAIMPLLPQKLNWCNKWEVIFRHTFCSLEFCVIASFDLAISRWITLAARLTKTVIAQVSQLSFLGIWKRRVGPTWSLAIKLAGNQMRSHHDFWGVSPIGGHLYVLGGHSYLGFIQNEWITRQKLACCRQKISSFKRRYFLDTLVMKSIVFHIEQFSWNFPFTDKMKSYWIGFVQKYCSFIGNGSRMQIFY